MKRMGSLVFAVLVGVGLTLTGCSSSDSGSGGGSGDGGQAKGKIGVILPDTKSSVRWESKDRPALEAAFKAAGVAYTILTFAWLGPNPFAVRLGFILCGVIATVFFCFVAADLWIRR